MNKMKEKIRYYSNKRAFHAFCIYITTNGSSFLLPKTIEIAIVAKKEGTEQNRS